MPLTQTGNMQNNISGGSPDGAVGLAVGSGTFTANGTTSVTVADARVSAGSVIVCSLKTVGGTVGAVPSVKTVTAGTGFTISGTASDTSVYNYVIL
jgi:hypothetical protein